jgi:tyrosine-protein phosphatase SIW14
MTRQGQFVLVALLVIAFIGGCYAYFRPVYEHGKRLRVVEPGKFYRSGQMTAPGFEEAIRTYKIRTVVNVQNDYPDPDLARGVFRSDTVKERELCRRLGVNYVWLSPDLQPRSTPGGPRPAVLDEFLALLDDPDAYPILLHCKAGLHRTGVLTAVYRMEYQGWSRESAFRELKAHGFGDSDCTCANDYVSQYVLNYTCLRKAVVGKAVGNRQSQEKKARRRKKSE